MNADVSTKVAGACMGLSGFSIAVIAGLAVSNPTDIILTRAIVALFVCNVVGLCIGSFMQRIVREYLKAYKPKPPGERSQDSLQNQASVPSQSEGDGVLVV